MNGISRKAHVAAIGIAAIVAIAQGDASMLTYYAFVCITVITTVAIVLQSFLDRNNFNGEKPNGKVKSKTSGKEEDVPT